LDFLLYHLPYIFLLLTLLSLLFLIHLLYILPIHLYFTIMQNLYILLENLAPNPNFFLHTIIQTTVFLTKKDISLYYTKVIFQIFLVLVENSICSYSPYLVYLEFYLYTKIIYFLILENLVFRLVFFL